MRFKLLKKIIKLVKIIFSINTICTIKLITASLSTRLYIITIILFAVISACGTSKSNKQLTEGYTQSENNNTLYAMGNMLGTTSNLAEIKLNSEELESVLLGFKHAVNNEESIVDLDLYIGDMQKFFEKKIDSLSSVEKEKGIAFLEKYKLKNDVVVTKSGLAYHVIKEGTGKMPTDSSTVEVHYHGTLTDGTVFDSSVERGKKISFPLYKVLKGWREGVQTMKVGGKTEFVIPSDIAYGDAGAPPKIPGGATLIFIIELFDVKTDSL